MEQTDPEQLPKLKRAPPAPRRPDRGGRGGGGKRHSSRGRGRR
jgi:hypothetical protein